MKNLTLFAIVLLLCGCVTNSYEAKAIQNNNKEPSIDEIATIMEKPTSENEKLCENGNMYVCYLLGLQYIGDDFKKIILPYKKQDIEKAKKAFIKSSDTIPISNIMLGLLYETEKNNKKADEFYSKACDLGVPDGCQYGGILAYKEKNYIKAKEKFEKGCDILPSNCYMLGMLYKDGEGVKQDYSKAKEFFEIACNSTLDFNYSCYEIGSLYMNGNGVKQNYFKAFEIFEKGCQHNNKSSCYDLGNLYFNGYGVRQNTQIAKEYYGKACDLGEQKGCDSYKKLK